MTSEPKSAALDRGRAGRFTYPYPYPFLDTRRLGREGRWRGGHGAVRRVRFLEPMTAAILSGHRLLRPRGMAGGEPGRAGRNWIQRAGGSVDELGP